MEYIKERKKEELREQLRTLEKEQEEFEYNTKRVLREEAEEDMVISRSHMVLMQMQKICTPQDGRIQQLICEKQDILSKFRRQKIEFGEEIRREMKRQRQKTETGIEEIYRQMSKLKYKEEVLLAYEYNIA